MGNEKTIRSVYWVKVGQNESVALLPGDDNS